MKLFMSCFPNERQEDISNMVKHLRTVSQIRHIYDHRSYNRNVEEKEDSIRLTDIVVIFLDANYLHDKRCKSEFKSSVHLGKVIIPVKIQSPLDDDDELLSQSLNWGEHIIDFTDPSSYRQVVDELKHTILSIQERLETFQVIDTPLYDDVYECQDNNITADILHEIARLRNDLTTDILVVTGLDKVGKTYFMSSFCRQSANQVFLIQRCKIRFIYWVNCFPWKDELKFGAQEKSDLLTIIEKAQSKYETCLFVFDDVYHFGILAYIHEKCRNLICIAIVRSSSLSTMQSSSVQLKNVVRKSLEISPMTKRDLANMLSKQFGLEDLLTNTEIRDLADQCNGMPILAANFAKTIKDGSSSSKRFSGPNLTKLGEARKNLILQNFYSRRKDGLRFISKCQDIKLINVPTYVNLFKRNIEENKLLNAIREVSLKQEAGFLIVGGTGGIGKSTVVSSMLTSPNNWKYFTKNCKIHIALWLNCYRWRASSITVSEHDIQQDFNEHLLRLGDQAAEFGVNDTGFRTLEEMKIFFAQKNMRILFVLDDVFETNVLEFLQAKWKSCLGLVITRDITKLQRFAMFSSIILRSADCDNPNVMSELSENEAVEMFHTQFKLKDKLSPTKLTTLAEKANGNPLLVSLLGAKFQDCDAHSYLKRYYELLNEKISSLVKEHVEKVFGYLGEGFRHFYRTFLLFDPLETVYQDDLAILWHCQTAEEAGEICDQFDKFSLVRNVIDNCGKSGYLTSQILHETAIEIENKDSVSLAKLRLQILLDIQPKIEGSDSIEEQIASAMNYLMFKNRRRLLEQILDHIHPDTFKEARCLSDFVKFQIATQKDKEGFTSLMVAAKCDQIHLVRLFYSQNAVAAVNNIGRTALMYAVDRMNTEVVRFLTETPLDGVLMQDIQGESALIMAAKLGHSAIARLLGLKRPDAISLQDKEGKTAIIYAIMHCTGDIPRCLAQSDPEALKMQDNSGKTALMYAIEKYDNDVACFLANICQSCVGFADNEGRTALIYAAIHSNFKMAKLCSDLSPESISHQDIRGQTALMYSAEGRSEEIAMVLAEKDPAGIKIQNRRGKTALIFASYFGNMSLIDSFIKLCPGVLSVEDNVGQTALISSAASREFEVARVLAGKSPEGLMKQDHNGRSAVMFTAQMGSVDHLTFMVKLCHESVKLFDSRGNSALVYANGVGDLEKVKVLIEAWPAVAYVEDADGLTIMMQAAKNGTVDLLRCLANYCPDAVTLADRQGNTALTFAITANQPQIVKAIVEICPDAVKALDKSGRTTLMHAAKDGSVEICRMLVEAWPVGTALKDKDGYSARQIAIENKNHDIASYLYEKTA